MRFLLVAALAALAGAAQAEARFPGSNFDPPVAVKTVDIGPAETVPPQEKEVRCSYFAAFMVKEIDEREVGATQLSILPPAAPCQRANLPEERVLDGKAWSGYFAGAHGALAVFSAEDGVNGGLGFALVRPADAKVLYSSVAFGKLQFDGDVLKFAQVYAGDCSVSLKGGACATRIGHAAGVAAPDLAQCKRGYAEAKRQLAEARCEAKGKACVAREIAHMPDMDRSPTVIAYPVEVALGATAAAHPVGAPTGCWPGD